MCNALQKIEVLQNIRSLLIKHCNAMHGTHYPDPEGNHSLRKVIKRRLGRIEQDGVRYNAIIKATRPMSVIFTGTQKPLNPPREMTAHTADMSE